MKLKQINQSTTDTVVNEVGSDETTAWDGVDSSGNLKPTKREIEANNERDWFITGDGEGDATGFDSIESQVKRHDQTLQQHSILLDRIDTKLDNVVHAVQKLGNK